ncbi:hypothetical protein B0T17DRAFT_186345 [Bombardia bombarda]|uniref:Uncharacterized protein n=1 Tax=Bombardia bombarda TaxID=252184 RepID=A0AA39X8U5_9PEZI|nr:hypothetical protein B0T17DRAFT_186345 [Bombardia bombarda]
MRRTLLVVIAGSTFMAERTPQFPLSLANNARRPSPQTSIDAISGVENSLLHDMDSNRNSHAITSRGLCKRNWGQSQSRCPETDNEHKSRYDYYVFQVALLFTVSRQPHSNRFCQVPYRSPSLCSESSCYSQ